MGGRDIYRNKTNINYQGLIQADDIFGIYLYLLDMLLVDKLFE